MKRYFFIGLFFIAAIFQVAARNPLVVWTGTNKEAVQFAHCIPYSELKNWLEDLNPSLFF